MCSGASIQHPPPPLAPHQDSTYGQTALPAPYPLADPLSPTISAEVRGAVIGARRAGQTQDAIILQVWGCTKGSNTRYLSAREKYRQIVIEAGLQ